MAGLPILLQSHSVILAYKQSDPPYSMTFAQKDDFSPPLQIMTTAYVPVFQKKKKYEQEKINKKNAIVIIGGVMQLSFRLTNL